MKVYVVTDSDYDFYGIHGIFTNVNEAKEYCKSHRACGEFSIECHNLGQPNGLKHLPENVPWKVEQMALPY